MKYSGTMDNRGLTLIELVVVMVLSLLLMASVYLAYQIQHQSSQAHQQVMPMQQDLRAAVMLLERDLRMAGLDPAEADLAAITSSSGGTSVGIQMDLNGDGTVAGADELIVYAWSSGSLTRNGNTVAENVTNVTFTYEDEDGATVVPTGGGGTYTTDDSEAVKFVRVALNVQSVGNDPYTGSPLTRSLSRRVRLRNYGM